MVAPRSESSAKLPPRRNMARERPVLSGQGGSRSGRRFPSGFAAKIMTNEEAIEALARDPNFVTALRDGYFLRTPREDAEVFAASGEFAAIRRLLAARIENATVADVGAGRGPTRPTGQDMAAGFLLRGVIHIDDTGYGLVFCAVRGIILRQPSD